MKKGRLEKKEVKDWQSYAGDDDKVSLVEFMAYTEYMKTVTARKSVIEQRVQQGQIPASGQTQ